MKYNKVLIIQLFISVALCSSNLKNTNSTKIWNHIASWNRTSEIPSENNTLNNKVHLNVYYETLCPASIQFFVKQLMPTVERLGSHLDVHLIPYGHAKTFHSRGQYYFECQHGNKECYINMVHACAIDVLRNITHAIRFNSCLMEYTNYHSDYSHFVTVLRWCGQTENVHIYDIWKCVNGGTRGRILLKDYGIETHELNPSYVPYLTLDGSTEYQDEAAGNLLATICQMLEPKPPVCPHHVIFLRVKTIWSWEHCSQLLNLQVPNENRRRGLPDTITLPGQRILPLYWRDGTPCSSQIGIILLNSPYQLQTTLDQFVRKAFRDFIFVSDVNMSVVILCPLPFHWTPLLQSSLKLA